MDIRLTPYSEELLKTHLARGPFRSPEEVIERALETFSESLNRNAEMNLAEFDAKLDALAEGSEQMPVLSSDATTREAIYRNHN